MVSVRRPRRGSDRNDPASACSGGSRWSDSRGSRPFPGDICGMQQGDQLAASFRWHGLGHPAASIFFFRSSNRRSRDRPPQLLLDRLHLLVQEVSRSCRFLPHVVFSFLASCRISSWFWSVALTFLAGRRCQTFEQTLFLHYAQRQVRARKIRQRTGLVDAVEDLAPLRARWATVRSPAQTVRQAL